MLKRILYLLYFLLKMDRAKIKRYRANVAQLRHHNTFVDALRCAWLYGTSFEDYYELAFYSMPEPQKKEWATTALAYQFHRVMNDPKSRPIFKDKYAFATRFARMFGREIRLLSRKTVTDDVVDWVAQRDWVMAKPRYGTIGSGVQKINVPQDREKLRLQLRTLANRGDHVLEDLIVQHPLMASLNATSVNTVRLVTVIDNDQQVEVIAAVLRMGNGGVIDNYSAGGMAAPVDMATGRVWQGATYRDSTRQMERIHPTSHVEIVGFMVPYWEETLALVKDAAWVVPEVRAVGWDIAITENGPILVEGNDNWDKTIVQRPRGYGLVSYFSQYMDVGEIYPRFRQ